jgi:hypothetical protein
MEDGLIKLYLLVLESLRVPYKDFLTFWKDADPGIPIYKQAKAEYARLQ